MLIFVSALDWMNIAFARNIEHEFILMAKRANRYQVENGQSTVPQLGSASKTGKSSTHFWRVYCPFCSWPTSIYSTSIWTARTN